MQEVRLALIGFGNVAQGLSAILAARGEEYARRQGLRIVVTAVVDRTKGALFHPEGIDPAVLAQAAGHAELLKAVDIPGGKHPVWDPLAMIAHAPADVVVEMSSTNLQTGEPATSYIAEALRRKKHVITTNKGPLALHYEMLAELARLNDVQIGIEGTVMSGTPVLRLGRTLMAPAGIQRIEGILNGTTNSILTMMEAGQDYADALRQAQALGYAESDPTNDVEGLDAAAKVAILARSVLDQPLSFADVERVGITGIRPEDIVAAREAGERWKLIGALEQVDGRWQGSVRPKRLANDHPLAQIHGAGNAIVYTTDLLGDVFLRGPGAGRVETGYAIIQDLFAIFLGQNLT